MFSSSDYEILYFFNILYLSIFFKTFSDLKVGVCSVLSWRNEADCFDELSVDGEGLCSEEEVLEAESFHDITVVFLLRCEIGFIKHI